MIAPHVLVLCAVAAAAPAGPVEFGRAELESALAARNLTAARLRISTEVTIDPAESFRIGPRLVTGGDLRGLMYGLLEAAQQIRSVGRLHIASGTPALAVRGVRVTVSDPDADWCRSREYWAAVMESLARSRFNSLNLVVSKPTEHAELVQMISEVAANYAVDFTLGLWRDPDAAADPELAASLSKLLSSCPFVRGIDLRLDAEAAAEALRAVQDTGRRMTLNVAAALSEKASSVGLPVRIALAYPGAAKPGASVPFYWEVTATGAQDRREIGRTVAKVVATGAAGFELNLAVNAENAKDAFAPFLVWGLAGYDSAAGN